jgi:hypothetical protein
MYTYRYGRSSGAEALPNKDHIYVYIYINIYIH